MDNSLLLLGLMKKARALAIGAENAYEAAEQKKARLLAVANDAAENSAASVKSAGFEMNVPTVTVPYSKEELGRALGQKECAAFGVTDTGFAHSLCEKLGFSDEAEILERRLLREKTGRSGKKPGTANKRGKTAHGN